MNGAAAASVLHEQVGGWSGAGEGLWKCVTAMRSSASVAFLFLRGLPGLWGGRPISVDGDSRLGTNS